MGIIRIFLEELLSWQGFPIKDADM